MEIFNFTVGVGPKQPISIHVPIRVKSAKISKITGYKCTHLPKMGYFTISQYLSYSTYCIVLYPIIMIYFTVHAHMLSDTKLR